MTTRKQLQDRYFQMRRTLGFEEEYDTRGQLEKMYENWTAHKGLPGETKAYDDLITLSRLEATRLIAMNGAYYPERAEIEDCEQQIAKDCVEAISKYRPGHHASLFSHIGNTRRSFSRWGAKEDGKIVRVNSSAEKEEGVGRYYRYDTQVQFVSIDVENNPDAPIPYDVNTLNPTENFNYGKIKDWGVNACDLDLTHEQAQQCVQNALRTLPKAASKVIELRYMGQDDQLMSLDDIWQHPEYKEAGGKAQRRSGISENLRYNLPKFTEALSREIAGVEAQKPTPEVELEF